VNQNTSRSYCTQRVASGPWFHAMLFTITPGMLSATVVDDQGNVRDSFQHAVP